MLREAARRLEVVLAGGPLLSWVLARWLPVWVQVPVWVLAVLVVGASLVAWRAAGPTSSPRPEPGELSPERWAGTPAPLVEVSLRPWVATVALTASCVVVLVPVLARWEVATGRW